MNRFTALIIPRPLHQYPKQQRLPGNTRATPGSVQGTRVAALILPWYRNACAALESDNIIGRLLAF
jgi:hypothetical protein